jgi:hypothetical protein
MMPNGIIPGFECCPTIDVAGALGTTAHFEPLTIRG